MGDAIATSLDQNYGIQIADMRSRVAATQNTWGNAGAFPRVDFNFNGRYFRTNNPASFLLQDQRVTPGLALTWTVFDGMAMFANKARLDLLEEQALGNAALVVETNLQAILTTYYDALVAQEAVMVLQEILDNSKERLTYEEFRLEVGSTSTFDILQFKNAVITDSANLIAQQLTLTESLRTLNRLMNVPLGQTWTLTDTLATAFPDYARDDLREKMLADNHNLENQYLAQRIRIQETRSAEALYYPTLTLNGNANYAIGQAGLADNSTREINAGDFSVGFALSFNLFNGFNTRRQVEVARLNEQITELETGELRRSLEEELFITYDGYQARRGLLMLQTQNVDNARLNLDLANDRFQSGLINTFDFRQVQLQYLDAQLNRLRALRDLNASYVDLLRLTGGLVREE